GRAINSFNRTKTASLVDRESPFRKSLSFVYNSYEDNIVVFDELRQDDLISAVESNAAGFISLTDRGMNYSRIVPLPGLLLNSSDAEILSNPVATIFRSETLKDAAAPVSAVFSSRGPSAHEQDLLKANIAAPGVEIIAAWAPNVPPSGGDKRSVKYSILSGTSMHGMSPCYRRRCLWKIFPP
ncbi:Subtilisin-like protease SBT4.4, partial [Thalictrum thalictroides]